MENVMNGNVISRDAAARLDSALRSASAALNEAVEIANTHCSPQIADSLKRHIAEAMATIGWDILERMVYAHHPDLRPYPLAQDFPDGA
jgi:hypothetical protein